MIWEPTLPAALPRRWPPAGGTAAARTPDAPLPAGTGAQQLSIATIWNASTGRGDWAIPAPTFAFAVDAGGAPLIGPDGFAVSAIAPGQQPGSGLVGGREIETAVLISIFTDAQADPSDAIPDGTDDPRGWWADPTMGSKLWLLQRAKRTPSTLQLAIAYLNQALAWLTADGIAAAVDVAAEWRAGGLLGGQVTVTEPSGDRSGVPFAYAWKDL